ncbi:MAG: sugar ABC transporter substrate-binding protein [Thermomicrobiales bacterium]
MSGFRRRSLSRRSIMQGAAASGAGLAFAVTRGHNAFAQDSSPAASPAASAPVSVVAERASGEIRLAGAGDAIGQEIIQAQLDGFHAMYPNIRVSFENIAAEYLVQIQTAIAAGNAADVFFVQNEFAQDFMSRDVLLPIDAYMAEDGITADMYYSPLISAYNWQDQLYGLPKDWSPIGAVYDPAAFESAGVTMPTTWDELRTTLQTLKDSTGTTALALDPSFDRFVIFMYQAGGSIINEDVTAITLDTPEVTQALEYFYGLYADGLSSTSVDIGAGWPGDAFIQGLTSMVFEGNWMFPGLNDQAPDKAFAVAELPSGPAGPGTPAFTQAYSIFSGSQNPDAAWVLTNYLTSVDGVRAMLPYGLALPALPALEPEFLELFPERAPYLAAGEYATTVLYGPGGQTFTTDANAVLQSLFAGSIDVTEAQAQLVTAAQNNITLSS